MVERRKATVPIRCTYCGRFMSIEDLEEGHMDLTFDTEFTSESTEWWHKACAEEIGQRLTAPLKESEDSGNAR